MTATQEPKVRKTHFEDPMADFYYYIDDVLDGIIVTGEFVQMAVERHVNDLKRTDIFFDPAAAEYAIRFFDMLNLNTDPEDFVPFSLSPFQKFIVGSLFGWKRTDTGYRRFNRAYIEIARKNGKTFFAAGISLFMMLVDGETSPKIFTGANTKSQALLCFRDAVNMVKASPFLKDEVKVREFDMTTYSKKIDGEYKYLSADASKHDGLRPHCVILDEIHEYKTNKLYGIFSSAMVNRTQGLILMITTAGFNKVYWCYREQRKFAIQVLKGEVDADNWFAIIYTLDPKDKWQDPKNWIKANPNLGISLRFDALEQEIRTAIIKPEERTNILTKNLNMWEDAPTVFIEREKWNAGIMKLDESELTGLRCHIGADLSYILDITAYTIAFRLKSGEVYLLTRMFVPFASAQKRYEATGIPYMDWIRDEHLIACEGETINYQQVEEYITDDFKKFGVLTAGFDFYNANHLMEKINTKFPKRNVRLDPTKKWEQINACYGIGQSFGTISPMVDLLQTGVSENPSLIKHDGNPVLEWMMNNVTLTYNEDGRKKPSKRKSTEKIDGVISVLLALEQLTYWEDKDITIGSSYENRDLRTL